MSTQAMTRHHIWGLHVGQFGVNVDPSAALDADSGALSSPALTPTTPRRSWAFGRRRTLTTASHLGLLDEAQAETERRYRAAQREALIAFLRAHDLLSDDASGAAVLQGWLSLSGWAGRRVSADQFGRSLARSRAAKRPRHLARTAQLAAPGALFPGRVAPHGAGKRFFADD